MRAATEADLEALVEAEVATFGADAWSRETIAAALKDTIIGERPSDYAVVRIVGDLADLDRIAVGPDHRKAGRGRALLREALARAKSAGAARMLLEVSAINEPALALYRSAGFVEIDRRKRYYRDGSDALVLQREVTTPEP